MTSFDNMWRERNSNNTKHQPNLRKETDEQIRQIYDRKIQLGMNMGLHDSVESLIKLPHRTKTEWLKHNTSLCVVGYASNPLNIDDSFE
jgi:hypothetical protein